MTARQWLGAQRQGMIASLVRFLVYRVAGGRFLIALTVFNWLRRRAQGRRAVPRSVAGSRGYGPGEHPAMTAAPLPADKDETLHSS